MRTKCLVGAFLVALFADLIILSSPLFSQSDFFKG